MPLYLLYPLFSSVVFVLGMMLVKRATRQGVSPWTGTFLANLWLAMFWILPAALQGEVVPIAAWGEAAVIGGLFVLGQLFTYLAFQYGDVSVATPVFVVKVLMVAALGAWLAGDHVPGRVWLAAALATWGVILVQTAGRRGRLKDSPPSTGSPCGNNLAAPTASLADRKGRTLVMALLAAASLSLFDVYLQKWGPGWNSREFLPVAFGVTALLSCAFLPWVDGPRRLLQMKSMGWILSGTLLMALQAVSMSWALATYGDAARINIVYALRGLWGVLLAWALARRFAAHEALLAPRIMLTRLVGALLLTIAVVVALTV